MIKHLPKSDLRRKNKMKITTEIKWTKLIMAFVFICSIFGFSAVAQTDKPMEEQAITALIVSTSKKLFQKIPPIKMKQN
jgi:hypothetical protein